MNVERFSHQVVSLQERLLRQAASFRSGDADAEDIVQETFLRLWAMRDRLDDHPNVEALALKTLHGIALDHWRHRQHELEQPRQRREMAASEERIEAKDELEIIALLVDRLPPLQRQIFRLKEIEDLESGEIMQICGCSADALRQNLSRARRRIQAEFIRITTERKQK